MTKDNRKKICSRSLALAAYVSGLVAAQQERCHAVGELRNLKRKGVRKNEESGVHWICEGQQKRHDRLQAAWLVEDYGRFS